jgi:hypothetical protein
MALTRSSFGDNRSQPPRASANDAAAQAVYADNDATRMHRMSDTAAVAAAHTTGPASNAAIGAPFIGEDHQWSRTPGKQAAGSVPGTPGFPGDTNWPPG